MLFDVAKIQTFVSITNIIQTIICIITIFNTNNSWYMKEETLKKAFDYLRNTGKAHTQQDVANKMGVNKTNVSRAFNGDDKYLTNNFLLRFNEAYDNMFDYNWLITGEGDMINQNTAGRDNYGSQGSGDNQSSYSNVGNTHISVKMPESGTQKIINPNGKVEIYRTEPSEYLEEINKLKQRIQDLERIIAEKDVTIQSKDDTINAKDELISLLKANRL